MYTIKIVKLTQEQVKSRNYVQIGTDDDGEAKFGYRDEETTEDVQREIYAQIVDELDLVKVINAVNNKEK